MARMIGPETRVNSDDVHYFDKQSALRPAPARARLPEFQASAVPHIEGADAALHAAIREEQSVALMLARIGFFRSKLDLFRAHCTMPANGNVRYWMSREFAGQPPDPDSSCHNEAVLPYRAMVAQHPDNPLALNALADALSETGDLDEALRLAQRAATLAPQNGMILDTHGWILFKQKRHDEALVVLEKAARFLPDHPIVLHHLGAIHQALGNDGLARDFLEGALRISSDFKGADDARALLNNTR